MNSFRELPFRGEVKEIAVIGNGKRCTLRITLPDGAAFAIPLSGMSGARTSIDCCEGVRVTTTGEDDVSLAVRYVPIAGYTMRLVRADVDYPGSDEDWAADCEAWGSPTRSPLPPESDWLVDEVRIEVSAVRYAETAM